jgi:ElaB/YqjD/DUF883 family membrane-anchored ribosome-binding protein
MRHVAGNGSGVALGNVRRNSLTIAPWERKRDCTNGENVMQSNEKISEALQLLSEAAKEKKDDIRTMISEKYSNLKDIVGGAGATLGESWHQTKARVVEAACEAKAVSAEKIHSVAKTVDENVHRSPWPYLGGVALGALLMGFMMGRSNGHHRR